jgi:nucleotide-binding universal stress UspA family protein
VSSTEVTGAISTKVPARRDRLPWSRWHCYRQAPLIAVMTYSGERTLGVPAGQPVATLGTGGDQRSAAEASLRNLLTGALGSQADHVELRVVAGIAGRQIVEAAREASAQLIVLATRGSVSLLRYAGLTWRVDLIAQALHPAHQQSHQYRDQISG